jgi:ribosome-associated protein
MIQVTPKILIDESEIKEEFIRSSGPGGQNVNKVATAVKLRFDLRSSSLSEEIRQRLVKLARSRVNDEGVLIIDSRRYRSQSANRETALGRLCELIREAAMEPNIRHKTRPTLASKKRRLDNKHHRSDTKNLRRPLPSDASD